MNRINEIVNELKQQNYQSFDEFYQTTSRLVYVMIVKYINDKQLVEDLMQDTYCKFLEVIAKIQTEVNPTAYLAQIAKNLAINEVNKQKRVVLDEEYVYTVKQEIDPENNKVSLGIIDYLTGDDYQVVSMHIVGMMKFKDIAKVMNKPLGTVLWIYNRAIKKLKSKVGDYNA